MTRERAGDRAAFLGWLNKGNATDTNYAASPNSNANVFEDIASGQRFDLHKTFLGIPATTPISLAHRKATTL